MDRSGRFDAWHWDHWMGSLITGKSSGPMNDSEQQKWKFPPNYWTRIRNVEAQLIAHAFLCVILWRIEWLGTNETVAIISISSGHSPVIYLCGINRIRWFLRISLSLLLRTNDAKRPKSAAVEKPNKHFIVNSDRLRNLCHTIDMQNETDIWRMRQQQQHIEWIRIFYNSLNFSTGYFRRIFCG